MQIPSLKTFGTVYVITTLVQFGMAQVRKRSNFANRVITGQFLFGGSSS